MLVLNEMVLVMELPTPYRIRARAPFIGLRTSRNPMNFQLWGDEKW